MDRIKIENYIKEHKDDMTCREIGRNLQIPYNRVRDISKRMGITFSRFFDNSNIKQWNHIDSPDIAYILGYLWADGSILRSNGKPSGIAIELQKEDADYLEKIYIRCKLKYSIHERDRPNRKPQKNLIINDTLFTQLLIDKYNFNLKSQIFFNLNEISGLEDYFILGFLDGDGHIGKRVEFASSYSFDWSGLIMYFKNLQIDNHNIRRWESKLGHKASSLHLRLADSRKFLKRLKLIPNLGLPRKQKSMDKLLKLTPK